MVTGQRRKEWLKEWLVPLILLALGGLIRFVLLGTMPGGMHWDEAFVAWNGYALWKDGMDSAGRMYPIYFADWGDGHSALYCWLLQPLYAMFGEEITTFWTRVPQALMGTLTLWAVYLLLKRMFGRTCGIWGLVLLAICPWHIMMCRWGLDANLAPAFLIFGWYFFVRGLDDQRYLPVSALAYGVGLYSYAVIWPYVPFVLACQIVYGLYHKKLRINGWSIGAAVLLFLLAVPLLLFVLVNSGVIGEIHLPFITIPAMSGYRGGELAFSLSGMWSNLRRVGTLLYRQNIGAVYDIPLPWGLFYDIGRVFILMGAILLVWKAFHGIRKKQFSWEVLVVIQLLGAAMIGCLVSAVLHQINCLYIPLVICETYGVWQTVSFLKKRWVWIGKGVGMAIGALFLLSFIGFQYDYYTSYRQVVNAYFTEDMEEVVGYAMEAGDEIVVERGAQWSRILFYSKISPSEYLDSVVYREKPAPAQFTKGEHTFYMGIDFKEIDDTKVYIFYYPDKTHFEEKFELKEFGDWYVAVPKAYD